MNADMLPFKKGVFHLAVAAQYPILPLAVSPLSSVIDARRWAVRPGTIRLRVLPSVPTAGLAPADVPALMSRVRELLETEQRALAAQATAPILPGRLAPSTGAVRA
jgi:1-acyl-sn-glycerol-3-phosphate acyltransferase